MNVMLIKVDEINESKEYNKSIKTYDSPQDKPVYNIDNAFTPGFIDFLLKKMVSHIMHVTSIKRVS
jgi:hypothetical protein